MNDGGSIILNSSIAEIKGFPQWSVLQRYQQPFVPSLAPGPTNSAAPYRVNAISPGHIDTRFWKALQQGDALIKLKEEMVKTVPLGRLGIRTR